MIGGTAWIGRLTLAAQVADHGDGARAFVVAFDAPAGTGGVVGGGGEGKVGLHVPFEVVDDGADASDALFKARRVRNFVRQDVPVSGRSLGVGTVCPEFGHHAGEVAELDDVRGVGLAGDGIDGMTGAVVIAEGVVSESAGGDVDQSLAVELAAFGEDFEGTGFVTGVGSGAEFGGWAGIDPEFVGIVTSEREGGGAEPGDADVGLDGFGDWDAVLGKGGTEGERLPAVGISEIWDAADGPAAVEHDHGGLWIPIGGVREAVGFAGTVGESPGEDGGGDAIANIGGSGPDGGGDTGVETQGDHLGIQRSVCCGCTCACGESGLQQPIGGVTDGLPACVFDAAWSRGALMMDVTDGGAVVSGPGVIHDGGEVM